MTTPADHAPREARLRPEFADRYPGVDPGVWYIAATLAEHLLARFLREGEAGRTPPERIMDPDHFEFRGETNLPRAFQGSRMVIGSAS
jgi:hypothetical protein